MRSVLMRLGLVILLAGPALAGPEVDAGGDPLPPMAQTRLGSVKLWQGMYVRGLAFGLDDEILISGGGIALNGPSVLVWDARSGRRIGSLNSSGVAAMAMRSSPDGKLLAVSTSNSQVWVFDLKTRKKLASYKGRGSVQGMEFTPDSGKLLFTNYSETCLLEIKSGKTKKWKIPGYAVSVHPDGKKFALCSNAYGRGKKKQGYVQIRSLEDGKSLSEIKPPKRQKYYWPSYSHDGKLLGVSARGAGQEDIYLFDGETYEEVRKLNGHSSSVSSLVFSPTEHFFATSGYDGKICTWDSRTGKRIASVSFNTGGSTNLSFSRDGKKIAAGDRFGRIEIWDAKTGNPLHEYKGHRNRISSLAISDDGRFAATADASDVVILWSLPEGKQLKRIDQAGMSITALAFTSDSQHLLAMSRTGLAKRYDLPGLKTLNTAKINGQVLDLRNGAPGEDVHVLLAEGKLAQWNPQKEKSEARQSLQHIDHVRGGLVSPDLRWGVYLQNNGFSMVMVENRSSHFVRHSGLYTYRSTKPVAIPVQSDLIGVSSQNGFVLYEIDSGQVVDRVNGSVASVVTALAFSRDGRFLAVGGNRGRIVLYSVASGKELLRFKGHDLGSERKRSARSRRHGILPGTVTALDFTPDGKHLISISNDTTGLVWDIAKVIDAEADQVPAGRLADFWQEMGDSNGTAAHRARWAMASLGDEATAFLEEHLEPAQPADRRAIRKLINQLSDPRYAKRAEAYKDLTKIGRRALPVLRDTLSSNPPAEVRNRAIRLIESLDRAIVETTEVLRLTRAVRTLERIGTPRAKALLGELAQGDPGSRMTTEAQAALGRLE